MLAALESLNRKRKPPIGLFTAVFFLVLFCALHLSASQSLTVGFLTGAGGLGDHAFTDSTYSGLRKAQQKYGFRLIVEEPGPSGMVSVEDAEKLISQSDVLVMLGAQHSDLASRYAPRYPAKRFLSFDDVLGTQPNLVSIVFKQHEGSFLVGALAGWMTRSKKVGFIGGTDFDVIHAFRIGFREGVHYAAPEVNVMETFVASGPDASGFANPQKAFEIADTWYKQGIDIIYAAAGPSGMGVIHAAKAHKRFAVGVDTDQDHMAKGYVLTSMIKRLDKAVFQEISQMMEGRFVPGAKYYGLKEGGVGLSPMTYTKHLMPAAILKQLNVVETKIISGEIKVTDYMSAQALE